MKKMTLFFVVFLGLFSLSGPAVADLGEGESCQANFQIDRTIDFIKELQTPVVLDSFDRDPSEFCDLEMAKRAFAGSAAEEGAPNHETLTKASMQGKLSEFIWGYLTADVVPDDQLKDDDFENGKRSESRFLEYLAASGWNNSLYPSERMREAVFKSAETWRESSEPCTKIGRNSAIAYDPGRLAGNEVAIRAACAEVLGVLHSGNCRSSFETIDQEMAGSESDGFFGIPVMLRVLGNAKYDRGLKIAADKLVARAHGRDAKGDLFGDLVASFRAAGQTEVNAEEMAWNTIGFLSMSGANIYERMSTLERYVPFSLQKRGDLIALANALPLLDHRSAHKGRLYSWPAGVSGACNTSKSYHFWGAAYLARRAAQNGGDAEAAAAASFQASKAYHVAIRNRLDDSLGIPGSVPGRVNSPSAQIVRADLAYGAAGAMYGANAAGRRTVNFNVDDGIRALLKDQYEGYSIADPLLRQIPDERVGKYIAWRTNMAPNTAFETFRGAGFPSGRVPASKANVDQSPDTTVCGQKF